MTCQIVQRMLSIHCTCQMTLYIIPPCMDNYWCSLFVRQVCYYKRQTTNKSLCKAHDSAQQLYFVNTYLQGNSSICAHHKNKVVMLAEYLVTTVV